MSAGPAFDDWPDYIIRPEVALEPPVAVVRRPPSKPAVYKGRPPGTIDPVPLLVLVVGLAAAGVWYAGVPDLTETARNDRGCEVIVLKNGKTRCVADPRAAWRARQGTHK